MRRLAAGLALTLIPANPAPAAISAAQVKAAYLTKLASFVRWPPAAFADPAAPLRICIAGNAEVSAVVEVLARGQEAQGRRLVAQSIDSTQPNAASHCHLLFVGTDDPAIRRLLAQVATLPVLTVTDRTDGGRGGIIEFVASGGNVRFAIHREAAEARKLALNSKLLAVAIEVEP